MSYTIPGAQEIILNTLFATFDGTSAASTFFPCIRIIAPGGGVVAEYIANSSVAAGASVEATFAPFLRGASTGAGGGTSPSTSISNISFVGVGAVAEGVGVTTLTVNTPAGLAFHDLLITVFGFEGVAAGSGPWISDSQPHFGWFRVGYQAPVGGAGTGIEIWAAIFEVGSSTPWDFGAASTVVARQVAYRNTAETVAAAITVSSFSAVAGDNPVAPSVTTTVPKSWVVPAVAQALAAGSFTYPAAYTRRFDSARGGASGNAEIAEGDAAQAAPGASGAIALTAASAGGTARGATATLALNPVVSVSTSASNLIGLTAYAPVADSTIASGNSTSPSAVDAANAVVFFTAPDSGNILVHLSALCSVSNAANAIYFGLLDGVTLKDEAWAIGDGGGAVTIPVAMRKTASLYVSGLTAGTTYGYKFAYRVGAAVTTGSIFAGPTFGRLVMEVWAAP